MSDNGIGSNSAAPELLNSYSDRINRLLDEKEQLAEDIAEIYLEAKGNGFDVRALRATIKRQRADQEKLREHEELVALYSEKLGILADTPLGTSAAAEFKRNLAAAGMSIKSVDERGIHIETKA